MRLLVSGATSHSSDGEYNVERKPKWQSEKRAAIAEHGATNRQGCDSTGRLGSEERSTVAGYIAKGWRWNETGWVGQRRQRSKKGHRVRTEERVVPVG